MWIFCHTLLEKEGWSRIVIKIIELQSKIFKKLLFN